MTAKAKVKPVRDSWELIRALESFANLSPDSVYWLGGDKADQGLSFCRGCAEKRVAKGDGEFADGGWGSQENDGCCHCEDCGCLLQYSLTDYGVSEELGHFTENPPTSPLTPDVAYHIARIVEAAPDGNEAAALAELAIDCIVTPAKRGKSK